MGFAVSLLICLVHSPPAAANDLSHLNRYFQSLDGFSITSDGQPSYDFVQARWQKDSTESGQGILVTPTQKCKSKAVIHIEANGQGNKEIVVEEKVADMDWIVHSSGDSRNQIVTLTRCQRGFIPNGKRCDSATLPLCQYWMQVMKAKSVRDLQEKLTACTQVMATELPENVRTGLREEEKKAATQMSALRSWRQWLGDHLQMKPAEEIPATTLEFLDAYKKKILPPKFLEEQANLCEAFSENLQMISAPDAKKSGTAI
jgi:hypothetical protein